MVEQNALGAGVSKGRQCAETRPTRTLRAVLQFAIVKITVGLRESRRRACRERHRRLRFPRESSSS